MPDDRDEGWCWEGQEGVGGYGGGEGADVFLAVLWKSYQHDSLIFVRNGGREGDRRERENIHRRRNAV